VELTGLSEQDAAVEIGPGLGQLTRPIGERARRTVALEIDRGLFELLRRSDLPAGVELRHQDALKADLGGIARELGPPVMLLGNLPYSISGRLLGALLSPNNPFRRLGFMLQREVAERVLAPPGEPEYGTLAVWASLFSQARRVLELGPAEFHPRPQVHSTFLLFDPVAQRPQITSLPLLRKVVRAAFQQRRKTLRRALRSAVENPDPALERAGIDPQRRGETLAAGEFVLLANALATLQEGG
jgi:16S rRNA (adenine1518-N6/adenine1519-N6)-dimethyltransferase